MCIDQHQRFCVPTSVCQHSRCVHDSDITEVLRTFFSVNFKYCSNLQVRLEHRYHSDFTHFFLVFYSYEHFTFTSIQFANIPVVTAPFNLINSSSTYPLLAPVTFCAFHITFSVGYLHKFRSDSETWP
jgi:hypothetical protein